LLKKDKPENIRERISIAAKKNTNSHGFTRAVVFLNPRGFFYRID
jgi:hypothetical protein